MAEYSLTVPLLITSICCKPPVFLTLSILTVVCYLTAIVSQHILLDFALFMSSSYFQDPLVYLLTFLVIFAAGWMFFFVSLARYEIMAELQAYTDMYRNSRFGRRIIPVALFHLFSVIGFEVFVYKFVNKTLPKDQVFNGIPSISQLERDPHIDRPHAVIVYTIWTTAVLYSFTYFMAEMFLMLISGNQSVIEGVNYVFVKIFVRLTGVDLSDLPTGESMDNEFIEEIQEAQRQIEDLTPPNMAEYATPQDTEADEANETEVRKDNERHAQLNSWMTAH